MKKVYIIFLRMLAVICVVLLTSCPPLEVNIAPQKDADDQREIGYLTYLSVLEDGVGGIDGLDGASEVAISPDGKSVYVIGENDDAVAVFNRDDAGRLVYLSVLKNSVGGVKGLDGAVGVAECRWQECICCRNY